MKKEGERGRQRMNVVFVRGGVVGWDEIKGIESDLDQPIVFIICLSVGMVGIT